MSEVALTVATYVGSSAIAVALFYSARQTQTLGRQYQLENAVAERALVTDRAANDLRLMEHIMAFDLLFVERPDIRPYFYEGQPLPEDPLLRGQVLSAAEFIIDLADGVANMIRLGQLDDANREGWLDAIRWYGRSPAVRALIENVESAWLPETISMLLADAEPGSHPASVARS